MPVWCSQIAAAYAMSRRDVNYQLDEEAEEEAEEEAMIYDILA